MCNLGRDNHLQSLVCSEKTETPGEKRTPLGCQGLRGQEPPLDQRERAQAKGRRRGILLKGKARRGPEGWRRGRHVRAGMWAGHVRHAGRSRVQLRQCPDPCTSLSSPQAQSRGLPVRPGPSAQGETTHKGRSVSSPRPQGCTDGAWHPSGLPGSTFRVFLTPDAAAARETDSGKGQWQGAKRQLCVRPPLSANVCRFLSSPAFRVGRPLLAAHGRTLSAAILSVARVESRNPFRAILVFLLPGRTPEFDNPVRQR